MGIATAFGCPPPTGCRLIDCAAFDGSATTIAWRPTRPCLSFPSPPAATALCYCHRHRLNHPAPPSAAPGAASPTTDRRLLTFRPQLSVCHHLATSLSWSYAASAFPQRPRTSPSATPPPQSLRPALGIASPTTDHWLPTASLPSPPSVTAHLPPSTAAATGLRDTVSVPAPACCRLPCRTAALPPATVSTRDNFIFNFFFWIWHRLCHGLATASAVVNINHDIRWLSCLAPQQLPPLALVVFPVASFIVTAISRSNCPFYIWAKKIFSRAQMTMPLYTPQW